jgi:hypothetical protein
MIKSWSKYAKRRVSIQRFGSALARGASAVVDDSDVCIGEQELKDAHPGHRCRHYRRPGRARVGSERGVSRGDTPGDRRGIRAAARSVIPYRPAVAASRRAGRGGAPGYRVAVSTPIRAFFEHQGQ